MALFQNCVWWSRPLTDFPKLAEKLSVIRTDRHENLVRPKNILPVRKKSPKKFSVTCIMFSLASLEWFTLVLAIGHLISHLQKNGGTDKKPMGKTEPQSDRKKKVFANSVIPNVWYNSYLRFCPKGIDQCLILFLNYIIFIVFTSFIHFWFQPNPFVKTLRTFV
jgi:hypothetical protein